MSAFLTSIAVFSPRLFRASTISRGPSCSGRWLNPGSGETDRRDDLKGENEQEEGRREAGESRSGRSSGGSCRSKSSGSAIGPGAPSTGASFPGKLVRNSDGPRRGPPRSRRGGSSRGGGRERGNRVPLYGHRNPGDPWLGAVSSTLARWRVPDRRFFVCTQTGSRDASPGAADSPVAWPSFPLANDAAPFGVTSFSTGRPSFCNRDCGTWHGGGLEDGG